MVLGNRETLDPDGEPPRPRRSRLPRRAAAPAPSRRRGLRRLQHFERTRAGRDRDGRLWQRRPRDGRRVRRREREQRRRLPHDLPAAGDLGPERRARPHHRLQPSREPWRIGQHPEGPGHPGRRDARVGLGLRRRGGVLHGPRSSPLDARLHPPLRPRGLPLRGREDRAPAPVGPRLARLLVRRLQHPPVRRARRGVGETPAARGRRNGPRAVLAARRLVPSSSRRLLRALGGRRARRARPPGLPLHGTPAG